WRGRDVVVGEQQRIAVRRRLDRQVDADRAAGAGAVLDEHLLAEPARNVLADEPGDEVEPAAGRERHDEAHRPVRIGLSARDRGREYRACRSTHDEFAPPDVHASLSRSHLRFRGPCRAEVILCQPGGGSTVFSSTHPDRDETPARPQAGTARFTLAQSRLYSLHRGRTELFMAARQLKLGAFMRPASIHTGAWRYPGAWPDMNFNIAHMRQCIQALERAKFDAFFMADHMAVLNMPVEALKRSHTVTSFEPFTLLSAL